MTISRFWDRVRRMGDLRRGKPRTSDAKLAIARGRGGRPFRDSTGGEWLTIADAARALDLDTARIVDVLKGRRKSTGGYKFTYLEVP